MSRLEKLNWFVGVVDVFTSDCKQINFIDCENGRIEFTTQNASWETIFPTIESHIEPLDEFINEMEEDDFFDLLDEIDCAC
jgi:hypothetical protein